MTNKLLVPAGTLLEILRQHPDVEVELVKNATMQVAEALRKRVDRSELAKVVVDDIKKEVSANFSIYTLPKPLRDAIDAYVDVKVTERVEKISDATVRKMLASAVEAHLSWREKVWKTEVERAVAAAAEKKVAELLSAMTKVSARARG